MVPVETLNKNPLELLTADKIAVEFGLPETYSYFLLKSRKLPAQRCGKKLSVTREALESFLRNCGKSPAVKARR